MTYAVPVLVHTNEPTYDTVVYHSVKLDIENLCKAIEHRLLDRATFKRGDITLEVYNIGDDGYNLFFLKPDEIEENRELSPAESIDMIKRFLA